MVEIKKERIKRKKVQQLDWMIDLLSTDLISNNSLLLYEVFANSYFFTIDSSEKKKSHTILIFYWGGEYFWTPCNLRAPFAFSMLQVSSNRKFLNVEDVAEVQRLSASDGNKNNIFKHFYRNACITFLKDSMIVGIYKVPQ